MADIVFDVLGTSEGGPITLSNYINGDFVSAASGEQLSDFDPATGLVVACIPRSDRADVDIAAAAAKAAFPSWSKTSFRERADILDRVADLVCAF